MTNAGGSARRIGAAVAVVAVVAVLTALTLGALGNANGVPAASGGIANEGSPTPTVAPSIGQGQGSPAPSGPSTPPGPVVVRVDSIPALLHQLADNKVDEIVVAEDLPRQRGQRGRVRPALESTAASPDRDEPSRPVGRPRA